MGIKEKINRKNRTRNIENIERRWIKKIVVTTIDVKITTGILDIENAPMTKITIT
jgi:hypothetical protein